MGLGKSHGGENEDIRHPPKVKSLVRISDSSSPFRADLVSRVDSKPCFVSPRNVTFGLPSQRVREVLEIPRLGSCRQIELMASSWT